MIAFAKQCFILAVAFALALFAVTASAAWTAAPSNPPNSNPPPPLNTGATAQVKSGSLGVTGAFSVGSTLDVALPAGSTGSRAVRVGFENTSEYTLLSRTGSGNASLPGRLFVGNYVGGNINKGGYIDFRPSANYTLIYPSGAASSTLRLYAGGAERVRLADNGNVGIGVTAPAQKLQVNGQVRATGLCMGADCRSTWPAVAGGTFKVCAGTDKTSAGCNSNTSIPVACSQGEGSILPSGVGGASFGERIHWTGGGRWKIRTRNSTGSTQDTNCGQVLMFTPI